MVSFSDLAVAVGPQLCCEKYLEDNFLEYILKSIFLTKKMLITRQILMAAKFRLQNRHCRVILHKICHFQPVPKFELSKKISWGPAFAKMPKMTDFFLFRKLETTLRRQPRLKLSGTFLTPFNQCRYFR